MHLTYDSEANAAYLSIVRNIQAGEAKSQIVFQDSRLRGEVILDLDDAGYLLGIEIIGATELLRSETLTPEDASS